MSAPPPKRLVDGTEVLRFVAGGVGNTLLTLGVYQLAVTVTAPTLAYALAWLVGLVLVALAYPRWVYRVRATWRGSLRLVAVYLASFAIGLALTWGLQRLDAHPRLSVFLVVAVTSAFSYLVGRRAVA